MGIAALGQNIRLPDTARLTLNLRTGDTLTLGVIKQISSGVWAVGLMGSVFRARSTLALQAGESYAVRVMKGAGGLELRLVDASRAPALAALRAAGFGSDPLSLLIITSLMKHNVTLEPQTVLGLREALARLKGDARRQARVLAWLAARGVGSDFPGLAELVAEASFGEQKEEPGAREDRHPRPREEKRAAHAKGALIGCLTDEMKSASGPLAFCNHLPSSSAPDEWIIMPYAVTLDGVRLAGTIRLRYDRRRRKVISTVVVAHTTDGRRHQFVLRPENGVWRMAVTSDDPRWQGVPLDRLAERLAPLAGLGVTADERSKKIGLDEACDGFEAAGDEPFYHGIDTEG